MSTSDFEYLINLIGPKIRKKNTPFREAISVQEKLAIHCDFYQSASVTQVYNICLKFRNNPLASLYRKFVKL